MWSYTLLNKGYNLEGGRPEVGTVDEALDSQV